jgi:preprotein translocase subunit SecF
MVSNGLRTIGSWLNYGVDFTGGTHRPGRVRRQPTTVDEIRAAVEPGWQITRFGAGRTSTSSACRPSRRRLDVDPAQVSEAADGPRSARTPSRSPERRPWADGRRELQQRALLAILVSFVLTLIYIAFRFEWRFGVAAVIATAHDILITLGFLALLNMEISVGTVAAFLTIVGYSLNDTIVVFDRIRENLASRVGALLRRDRRPSINETLPRTVLTSGTTLAHAVRALHLRRRGDPRLRAGADPGDRDRYLLLDLRGLAGAGTRSRASGRARRAARAAGRGSARATGPAPRCDCGDGVAGRVQDGRAVAGFRGGSYLLGSNVTRGDATPRTEHGEPWT